MIMRVFDYSSNQAAPTRLRRYGLPLVALISVALMHCGPPPSVVSCMLTTSAGMFTTTICEEASGLTSDQDNALRATCQPSDAGNPVGDSGLTVTQSGTYSESACPRANAIGGCRVSSGAFSQTVWYYNGVGFTPDIVQSSCMSAHGTFVMP